MARTKERVVLFALWLLVFSASSQIMIIAPILPQIGQELSIADAALGTLVSAYALMVGCFAVISGPISDRIGRRRILLLGAGVMTIALSLHALVAGYWSFMAVRVFAGIAGGILSGAAVAYVGDYFPYERRGWATGWVMSGSAFGQILGIPLGVLLAGSFGFRSPFYLFAVAMGIAFILVWFRVPQPEIQRIQQPLSVRGAISDYRKMVRREGVLAAATAFFLLSMGISIFVVYLPTWLESSFGASPGQIAMLFLIGGVGSVVAGPQAGRLSDRVGRKGIILHSCIGLSVVMALTTFLTREMGVAYPLFFLAMMLFAMRIGPFSAMLTALVPDRRRGSLMSLIVALGQVGYALGGGVAGPVYAELGYRIDTIIGALAVLGMGTLVWTLVPEPKVEGPVYPTLDTLAEPVRVSVSGLSSPRHRSGWDRGSG